MASGVEELLDMLFEMVDEAKNMPLSSDKCVLERDRALDLIDDIRAQFPVELGEAKKLVASRNDYIAAAKREAEVIRKQAEAEAQRMLAEESVLNQAKQRSAELMRQAEERSRELKRSANEYCEDALRRTEEAVAEAYNEIKQSRARFRAAASSTANMQGWVFLVSFSSSSVPPKHWAEVPGRRASSFAKISAAAGEHWASSWPMPGYWAPWPAKTKAILPICPLLSAPLPPG